MRPDPAVRFGLVCGPEVLIITGHDRVIEDARLETEMAQAFVNDELRNGQVSISPLAIRDEVISEQAKAAGTRGAVTAWSSGSRKRMVQTMAMIGDHGRRAMMTLTLDAVWTHKRYSDGIDRFRTPAVYKAEIAQFRMRVERRYGALSAFWKMETQERGAPHHHLLPTLPELEGPTRLESSGLTRPRDAVRLDREWRAAGDAEYVAWCSMTWHSIVCHDGAVCTCVEPDRNSPADVTKDGKGRNGRRRVTTDADRVAAHRTFGLHVDLRYAQTVKQSRSTVASYFAKHGVWSTKEYQNRTPGAAILKGLVCVEAFAPLRRKGGYRQGRDGSGVLFEVRPDDLADWYEFAAIWETPGRWWGMWRTERVETMRVRDIGEYFSADGERLLHRARLLARKIVKRRSQRLVVEVRPDGSLTGVTTSRTLRSLHGDIDRGWWLIAKDAAALMSWLLSTARRVLYDLDGLELARALAGIELPTSEPRKAESVRSKSDRTLLLLIS